MKKLLLASRTLLGIVTNGKAAVGDTFVSGNLLYTILTEDTSNGTGTVNVAKTTNYQVEDPTQVGVITIPELVTQNEITYTVTQVKPSGFRLCTGITKVILPEGITTINAYAFQGCTNMEEIVIPTTLTKSNNNAFQNCTSLLTVTISDLDAWKAVTFANSGANPLNATSETGLSLGGSDTITIPDGTTSIPEKAYYKIKGIKEIVVPSTVKSIGKYAFQYCLDLETINIPDGVTSIQDYTFADCHSLKNIDLNKVSTVSLYAFQNSYNLETVTANNLKTIKNYAFRGCTKLQSVTFEKVTTIGQEAFQNCALQTINLPNVTTISSMAFENNPLNTINLGKKLTLIGSITYKTVNGQNVQYKNSGDVFRGCANTLQEVIIDPANTVYETRNNIPCIIEKAINKIILGSNNTTIPDGIEIISGYAYYGCSFTSIDLSSVDSLEIGSCFENCTALENVTFSPNLKSIPTLCFANCTSLHDVILPDGLLYVDGFRNCTSITHIEFPEGLYSVDGFYGTSLQEVRIPGSVKIAGMYAFAECNNLTTAIFEEGAEKIGYNMFENCTNLSKVTLPSTLNEIHDYAFFNCSKLEYLNTLGCVHNIGYMNGNASVIFYNSAIRQLPLPNSLTSIGRDAFANMQNLNHVSLPSHLEEVHTDIFFNDRNIKELTLPASLTSFNDGILCYYKDSNGYTRLWENCPAKAIFVMGDEIPNALVYCHGNSYGSRPTIYVKESVYIEKYPNGQFTATEAGTGTTYNFPVSYKIPVTMGTTTSDYSTSNFKSMCRDFDADFSDPNVTDPELKVWLAADYNGNNHNVMMQQLNYVPSRLKANVTDPETGELYQGVDEYVGVILEGTPGKTYYYKMGEHDYTQGAEGQWLLEDAQQNFLVGANDDHYVNTTTVDKETEETRINYGLKNGYFKKYVSEGFINYNKSFLSLPEELLAGDENYEENNAKGIGFEFYELDGTTRILSAQEFSSRCEEDIFNGKTYNLQGQAVGDDYKGFVIQNGKKFIRK